MMYKYMINSLIYNQVTWFNAGACYGNGFVNKWYEWFLIEFKIGTNGKFEFKTLQNDLFEDLMNTLKNYKYKILKNIKNILLS